ncbi:NUDIX hydrolase [Actinoplanes sp. SE50]|uniref:NUDIX hydrolase n=1 Tax=unclassified Actinoplanes TaxID=2626549 RepID=UPI00023EDEC7|nr:MULTISPECIES: NUDIX hydrolase [unclassified Actinoplanes]AEV88223.1 NUDIX hydrolase [Actinoplanes sp. SE50/110]ATO86628.1 NUDIX hydrolase [Actinoplanes sp. SE50]SLM04045.1 NUDIX hydrolase [Actinoplanes sp. SE50/110]
MAAAVRAAGGVLYRPGRAGVPEICLVHRPRYDDWSLPKGTLRRGEPALAAAVREVAEETGVAGIPEMSLPEIAYELPGGRPKTVRYWLMRAGTTGPIQDTAEVDRLAWLPLPDAAARLTYPDERPLLDRVAGLPPITSVVALVRHAHAGDRKDWSGPDSLRPVSVKGGRQAQRVAARLATFQPRRLVAATPLRCTQTLQPLAAATGLPIVSDIAFAEPDDLTAGLPARLKEARGRLDELRRGDRVVICSQGKVIPELLAGLRDAPDPEPFKTRKGDGWLLTWSGERLLAIGRW